MFLNSRDSFKSLSGQPRFISNIQVIVFSVILNLAAIIGDNEWKDLKPIVFYEGDKPSVSLIRTSS